MARHTRFSTACMRGHLFTEENTYVNKAGSRCCRACTCLRASNQRNKDLEKSRRDERFRLYHLTDEQFVALIVAQDAKCICGASFADFLLEPAASRYGNNKPCIDHDRRCCPRNGSCGKCIRGILCRRCNLILGLCEKNGLTPPIEFELYLRRIDAKLYTIIEAT